MKRPALASLLALVLALLALTVGRYDALTPPRQQSCRDIDQWMDVSRISVASTPAERSFDASRKGSRVDGSVEPMGPLDMPMMFSLRRAWVMTKWLIRPTRTLPGPKEPDVLETVELQAGPHRLPVVFARQTGIGEERFAAYVYALDDEALGSPFWARIRTAPEAFGSGLRPLVLFAVTGSANRARLPAERQRALDWIEAAWLHYVDSCGPW